jgi:rubrerythrin
MLCQLPLGETSAEGWFCFACVVVAIIAGVIKAANQSAEDQKKWFGKMQCASCGYFWISRRIYAPASCPRCRSKDIVQVLGR